MHDKIHSHRTVTSKFLVVHVLGTMKGKIRRRSRRQCDCLVLTETWLRPGDESTVLVSELCPQGYSSLHVPRPDNSGYGGLALVFKYTIKVSLKQQASLFASFELMHAELTVGSLTVHIFAIYRPPPSRKNRLTFSDFYDDFAVLLETVISKHRNFLLVGDLNVHFDDLSQIESKRIQSLLTESNLVQLVTCATHQGGHTLDPVITSGDSQFVRSVQVVDNAISDHLNK